MSAKSWLRLGLIATCLLTLGAWLFLVGSYSWTRDISIIFAVTAGLAWFHFRRKDRRLRRENTSCQSSWADTIPRWLPVTWLVLCWISMSMADSLFRQPLPLARIDGGIGDHDVLSGRLSIGLTLSGGGYRAALLHSGVIQELAVQGVLVTNIVSVSGGSIIGAFVAQGGDPADFVSAVVEGRFNLRRELTSALHFPRWILPFGAYSRRDVQAELIRSMLIGHVDYSATSSPRLMVALTDLRHGLSIGVAERGIMMVGPTTSRFFGLNEAVNVDFPRDLGSIVAVSGAFPGAFPALRATAQITTVPEPLGLSSDVRMLDLALVDGGVRDNLGLRLMQEIDKEARGAGHTSLSWSGFRPGPDWMLDMVIVSDGGQSLDVAEGPLPLVDQIRRAIDLSSLETGILRPIDVSRMPVVSLAIASRIALSPDATIAQRSMRPRTEVRRDFFRPESLSEEVLERLINISSDPEVGRQVLEDFQRTRGGPINITDIDARCVLPENLESSDCHWRSLVDFVLDDIDEVTSQFRNSETLRDRYSAEEAASLVRLGRYLVLLSIAEIRSAITIAGDRKE